MIDVGLFLPGIVIRPEINWQSFDIAPSEAVRFAQPSNSSIALNRALGACPTDNALVSNHGTIKSDDGSIELSAVGTDQLVRSAVNNDGIVEANSLINHDGVIRLTGTNRRRLAGAGLTWLEAHGLQVTFTLATQLGRERAISDTDSHLRGWVQVSSRF